MYFNYLNSLRTVRDKFNCVYRFYIGNNCGSKKKPYVVLVQSYHKSLHNLSVASYLCRDTNEAASFVTARTRAILHSMSNAEIKSFNPDELWLDEFIR